jgi:hypothetical protein
MLRARFEDGEQRRSRCPLSAVPVASAPRVASFSGFTGAKSDGRPRAVSYALSERAIRGYEKAKEDHMIVLGLILLILGWVLGIGILVTIGIILLIIGVVFLVLGQMGRAVGGRKYWF